MMVGIFLVEVMHVVFVVYSVVGIPWNASELRINIIEG